MCDSTKAGKQIYSYVSIWSAIVYCILVLGSPPHLAFIVTFHVCPGGEGGPPHADIEAKKGGGGGGGYHLHNRTSLQLCT